MEVVFRNRSGGGGSVPSGWGDKGLKLPGGGRGPAQSCWSYEDARNTGAVAMQMVFPQCDRDCVDAQLDAYHKQKPPDGPGVSNETPVRTDMRNGIEDSGGPLNAQQQSFLDALADAFKTVATA
jgi:hypothetical protein